MGMTYKQKVDEAKKRNIHLPTNILDKNFVGVYGFFAKKPNETTKYCFYIGKATNIASRLLKSSYGHVYSYLNQDYSKFVPSKIKEYIDNGYEIYVDILDEVNYEDTSFSIATHRLALAELQKIVYYQNKGQCIEQLPEGVGKNQRRYWEENYKI